MKALLFRNIENIEYETTDDPKLIEPSDVILKMDRVAICGSDLHPYFGREVGIESGTVMGHEGVGTVVEVGREVRTLKVGDRVFSPFSTNCGECFYCRKGLTCRCEKGQLFGWIEKGKGLHGLQAEYARVPMADATLLKIPHGICDEEALLLGDVLSTGFFCAEQASIEPDGHHVVIGCGPVGLMAVVGAKEKGSQNLYALDTVPERLALAEKFGAVPVNINQTNPVDFIKNRTSGRGADSVMEAVGNASAEKTAFALLRPGGTLSVAGVHTASDFSFSPPDAYNKNLTYRVGRCPSRFYMERLVPVVLSKKYPLTELISHRLGLKEGKSGYQIFSKRVENCTKVVLTP